MMKTALALAMAAAAALLTSSALLADLLPPSPPPTAAAHASPRPSATPRPTSAHGSGSTPDMSTPRATPAPDAPLPTPPPTPERVSDDMNFVSHSLQVHIVEVVRDDVTFYAADIRVADPLQMRSGFAGGKYGTGTAREHPSVIASRYPDCVFAINGDYFGFHTEGVVVREGVLYRNRPRSDKTMLCLFEDGSFRFLRESEAEVSDLLSQGLRNTFSFGPVLVREGQVNTAIRSRAREPRCGIGMYEPGHYLAILVDGRRAGYSEGMTWEEFADLFGEYGVQEAYNLDGGGSATMILSGRVVNRPSGLDERPMSDILYFCE